VSEQRLRARVAASARVLARVEPSGKVVELRVVQRLTLDGRGDYVFGVPAPALDAVPGPGSESAPGLRSGVVLWQGFSPGTRVLVADVKLDPVRAARWLPLRVTLTRSARGLELRVDNRTGARVASFGGEAEREDVGRALASVRRALAAGSVPSAPSLELRAPPVPRPRLVGVAFRVSGALRLPAGTRLAGTPRGSGLAAAVSGRRITFEGFLPPGRTTATLSIPLARRGTAAPGLRLVALPVRPEDALRLPADADRAQAVDRAVEAMLRLARARQYERFLANPDPAGPSETAYVYSLDRPVAVTAAASAAAGGHGTWRIAVVLLGAIVVGGLGLVLWAHA
jgi:hypothetical protein